MKNENFEELKDHMETQEIPDKILKKEFTTLLNKGQEIQKKELDLHLTTNIFHEQELF
jgi:hypothetical protein